MPEDNPKPGARPAVVTTTVEEVDALEERTLRALHGSSVPGDFPLPQKDEGAPSSVQAKLRALEQAAFERAGRLAEVEAELEQAEKEEAERDAARAKIVARLKDEAGDG
jgi:hypothetical protein